jgi:D-ribose pyranose/furanose isomerase RbsD
VKSRPLLTATLWFVFTMSAALAQPAWQVRLQEQLPLLGHRNWIVIADAAYPLQTAPGIDTVFADADPLVVLQTVLDELARARHVRPTIHTDAELPHVAEKHAPGITAYREGLGRVLAARPVQSLPHEEIIAKLDEAGKTFRVLLIKTPLTLPYTSVFCQLECGYWTADAEQDLREALRAVPKPAKSTEP